MTSLLNLHNGVQLKKIIFKNILSFSNVATTILLDAIGTTLITGENLDEGGSSGAGKSSIIAAISYALFDKVPSGISKERLINRTNDNKKVSMEVELWLIVNGIDYIIKRSRGARNEIKLICDGKDITPDSVNNFNTAIEDVIGFSFAMFSQVILFNNSDKPFLDIGLADQRKLVEELLKITMLSKKAEVLKKDIVDTDQKFKLSAALFNQTKAEYDNNVLKYHRDLNDTTSKFEVWEYNENQRILNLVTSTLNNLTKVKKESTLWADSELLKLNGKITLLKSNIQSWNKTNAASQESRLYLINDKIDQLNNQLFSAQEQFELTKEATPEKIKELEGLEQDYKKLLEYDQCYKQTLKNINEKTKVSHARIDDIESQLKHLSDSNCPYCKQLFVNAESKIIELKQELEAEYAVEHLLAVEHLDVTSDYEFNKNCIDSFQGYEKGELDRLIKLQNNGATLNLEILKLENSISTAKLELDQSQNPNKAQNPYENELIIAEQKLKEFNPDSNPYIGQIAVLQQQYDEALVVKPGQNPYMIQFEYLAQNEPVAPDPTLEQNLNSLASLQEHQKLLLKLLTDKNSFIRKAIISKTLPFLNERIDIHTEQLGLPHVVTFQPDMTCTISQYGRELDHGNLSAGEKKRLNLSLCLAFRDTMTYIHQRVNVLFADEIDGGSLDEQAVTRVIKMLKRKAHDDKMGIFIISHRPEFEGQCDKTLIVRKENGFSSILIQP